MDVIIIGSGPAGYTSAIYTSRARLTTLLFQGITPGGQLTTTDHVENFPGFPDGISGVELCERMEEEAKKTGTEIVSEEVQRIDDDYKLIALHHYLDTDNTFYQCHREFL